MKSEKLPSALIPYTLKSGKKVRTPNFLFSICEYPEQSRRDEAKENKLVGDESLRIPRAVARGSLFVYKDNQTPSMRLAVIVGKSYSKKATKRNKIKRLIKEAISKINNPPKNLDFVIIAKTTKIEIQLKEILKELGEVVQKV